MLKIPSSAPNTTATATANEAYAAMLQLDSNVYLDLRCDVSVLGTCMECNYLRVTVEHSWGRDR